MGRGPPTPIRRVKVPAGFAALFAQLSFTAAGAFVDGEFPAGPGGRDGDRRAGLLVAAAERGLAAGGAAIGACRPVGVKTRRQTGQVVVPWSSRDGIWGVVFGAFMVCGSGPPVDVGVVRSVG